MRRALVRGRRATLSLGVALAVVPTLLAAQPPGRGGSRATPIEAGQSCPAGRGGTPVTLTSMRCAAPKASAASRTVTSLVSMDNRAGPCVAHACSSASTVWTATSRRRILWR